MKFSGVIYSLHPVKGRVERTVVLDEIVYDKRRFWKSKTDWFSQEDGRNFNPRGKWTLHLPSVVPLPADSPLLHPIRRPRATNAKKSAPSKVTTGVKPIGGGSKART
jgi:hypothetical protein